MGLAYKDPNDNWRSSGWLGNYPVYGDGNDSDYDDNVVMMVVMVMW